MEAFCPTGGLIEKQRIVQNITHSGNYDSGKRCPLGAFYPSD